MKINILHKSQFTLIELLVVIGIIGILSAVLLPAVSSALNNSKKTKAKSECVQIAMAIAAYKADYGKLPTTSTSTIDTEILFSDIQDILNGDNTSGKNPRQKVYYSTSDPVKNPWNDDYKITLDLDYDGKIIVPVTTNSSTQNKTVSASVAVKTEYILNEKTNTVTSW
jgi:prepilin-type N-terminal cleavage/methylation domain-containing protein